MGRFNQMVQGHRDKVDQQAADEEAAKIEAQRAQQTAWTQFQVFLTDKAVPLLEECARDLESSGYSANVVLQQHPSAAILTFNVKREAALNVNASDNSQFSVILHQYNTRAQSASYPDQRVSRHNHRVEDLGEHPFSIAKVEGELRQFLQDAFARLDAN